MFQQSQCGMVRWPISWLGHNWIWRLQKCLTFASKLSCRAVALVYFPQEEGRAKPSFSSLTRNYRISLCITQITNWRKCDQKGGGAGFTWISECRAIGEGVGFTPVHGLPYGVRSFHSHWRLSSLQVANKRLYTLRMADELCILSYWLDLSKGQKLHCFASGSLVCGRQSQPT